MRVINGHLVYWATDLSNFLACRHLTAETRAVQNGAPLPPKFEDPANRDLRLKATSDALGKGTVVPVGDDRAGGRRPTSSPDVGAYERN